MMKQAAVSYSQYYSRALLLTGLACLLAACATINGESFYQAGRYQAAAEIFIRQAEQGDIMKMHRLAEMYASGMLSRERDYQQAVYWYQEAADRQDVPAMLELGIIHEFGLGNVKQDSAQAAYWYQQAADRNHAYAQYRLGHLLAQQADNSQAKQEAYRMMLTAQRAAEQRNACRQPHWCQIVADDLFNYRWQLSQQLTQEQRQAVREMITKPGS